MLRYAVGLLAVTSLVGCTTSELSQVGDQPKAAIKYAALSEYPKSMTPSHDLNVGAINDRDAKVLRVYNFGDQTIPASTLWVNGGFLSYIDSIPPKGHVSLKYSQLLEQGQNVNDFSKVEAPMAKVELQNDRGLFAVEGPAAK
jgi:hypothetical protein